MKRFWSALLASMTLVSCMATEGGVQSFVAGSYAGISADQAGQVVSVQGIYMQWSGSCLGAPPRTRSDWMLQNESGCIYISGKKPNIAKKTTVAVQGTVVLMADKTPFIVADKVVVR